jgi:hypothetical protein
MTSIFVSKQANMETLPNLLRSLSVFELNQFDLARNAYNTFSDPCLSMCEGTAQFVVVQGPCVGKPDRILDPERRLPVICVVGSNYYQRDAPTPRRAILDHFLSLADPVVDHDLYRGMRNTLDLSLAAHNRNRSAWIDRPNSDDLPSECKAYGSKSALAGLTVETPAGIFVRDDYILVVTNLSPFITIDDWTNFSVGQSKELLKAWPPTNHLDPLAGMLGECVDLWVGHGKVFVWQRFWSWRESKKLKPWILTSNLSLRTLRDDRKAGTAPKNTDYPDPRYR